jgi:hypothetical protein
MTLSTDIFPPQSSDLNGVPFRIHIPDYIEPRMTTLRPERLELTPPMTSSESPELSEYEIADIHASEEEFASGHTETYDSPQDLIASLHATRERHRRSVRGQ